MIFDVDQGIHTLQVVAVVDGGILHIPHFNPALIEETIYLQRWAFILLGPEYKSCKKRNVVYLKITRS